MLTVMCTGLFICRPTDFREEHQKLNVKCLSAAAAGEKFNIGTSKWSCSQNYLIPCLHTPDTKHNAFT